MPWSWSCVQVKADPGERYLQVLSSADIQAGDVLDPLIDLINNRMLECSEPGADGQDRVKPWLSTRFNPNQCIRELLNNCIYILSEDDDDDDDWVRFTS